MQDTEKKRAVLDAETEEVATEEKPITPRYGPRWKEYRNFSLNEYEFPFQPYRPGQRNMMASVYTAIRDQHHTLIQAPTGIGKTLGTLYPALKAMGKGHCDKIFFLAARTTGKMVAVQACNTMRETGAVLSYVEIISKEKICFNTSAPKQCDECVYALGYENRIDDALEEGCAKEAVDRDAVEEVAKAHRVCPFELSLDLSLKMDVIICDYNYAFDPRVYLKRYFDKDDTGDFVFLVDEGHNLVDRGRSMFSADVSLRELEGTRYVINGSWPVQSRALERVVRLLKKLEQEVDDLAEAQKPEHLVHNERFNSDSGRSGTTTTVLYGVPEELNKTIKNCLTTLGKWLENTDNVSYRANIREMYYQLTIFFETADKFGPDYRLLLESSDHDTRWNLFCIDPACHLEKQFGKCVSAVVFSATLFPMEYYQQVLGVGKGCRHMMLPSPFPPENLKVLQCSVDTTYRNRDGSMSVVVEKIHQMLQTQKGNFLVFFPAYRYMEQVYELFVETHRDVGYETFKQESTMSEEERLAFIDRLQAERFQRELGNTSEAPVSSTVGFAVLGGVFGEGIDLVGERLVGVAIVGVGMPGLCAERNEIKDYYGGGFKGFQFAYTFPGMTKVLQAAGRVIRTPEDKGVVLLLDSRFNRNDYRRLLPPHWNVESI